MVFVYFHDYLNLNVYDLGTRVCSMTERKRVEAMRWLTKTDEKFLQAVSTWRDLFEL